MKLCPLNDNTQITGFSIYRIIMYFSGRCICNHNTVGNFCERCTEGFYGDSRDGTEDDCKPCPCPGQGPCVQLPGGEIICTACQHGYGGK